MQLRLFSNMRGYLGPQWYFELIEDCKDDTIDLPVLRDMHPVEDESWWDSDDELKK